MDSVFSLRPATPDDLVRIIEIERQAMTSPWTEENFRLEMNKPYSSFLVLSDDETDTEIAGYIVFWMMFDECQILNIVVSLPYRGLGYAKLMVRKAVTLASNKGIQKVLLDVRKSNTAAIQLYQSMGFTIVHVRKAFYSDGEDAYQMALNQSEQTLDF